MFYIVVKFKNHNIAHANRESWFSHGWLKITIKNCNFYNAISSICREIRISHFMIPYEFVSCATTPIEFPANDNKVVTK